MNEDNKAVDNATLFKMRFKDLKNEKRLTQQELADKLYISKTKVGMIECGLSVPNFDDIVNLAKLFDVSADYLLGLSKEKDDKEVIGKTLNEFNSRW